MWAESIFILSSYLFGSIPFVWALARLGGVNLRQHGSGSISSSNLWQTGGALEGFVGGFTDFIKAIVPVLAGRALGFDLPILCLAGLAAVAGQCWPVFLKFSGGRGGATGYGLGIALAPKQLLIAVMAWLLAMLWVAISRLKTSAALPTKERMRFGGAPSGIVPLGMLLGFAILPILCWLFGQPLVIWSTFVALFLLITIRRVSADIQADIHQGMSKRAIIEVLLSRFLFDRSYR